MATYFGCLDMARSVAEFEEYTTEWCGSQDIKGRNYLGQTLLHAVVTDCTKSPHVDYLRFLLGKGVDPTVRDDNGATVLYEIINRSAYVWTESKVEELARLVDVTYNATVLNFSAKKSINYSLDSEHTALSLACCKLFTPTVSRLLDRGASVATTVMLGLCNRCYNNSGGYKLINASLLHCLARHTLSREIDQVIPLAQILVDKGLPVDVTPDPERITPLMVACLNGNEPLANWFLSMGAQINAVTTSGETPLNFAFADYGARSNLSLIRSLIARGAVLGPRSAKLDFAKNVYLCGDALFFYEELLKVLSSSEEEPELVSVWLLFACAGGYIESIRAIVSSRHPVDINISEGKGMTPFLLACKRGFKGIVELLLSKGADPKRRAKDGRSALHFAAKARDPELIRKIIPYMPEYLEICSVSGKTPLVTAVESDCGSGECVIALVEAGANHLITYSGETLLQIAERKNCSSGAVAYLRTLSPSRL